MSQPPPKVAEVRTLGELKQIRSTSLCIQDGLRMLLQALVDTRDESKYNVDVSRSKTRR